MKGRMPMRTMQLLGSTLLATLLGACIAAPEDAAQPAATTTETASSAEALTSGGTVGGGRLGVTTGCHVTRKCTFECTDPKTPDDIYHCDFVCRDVTLCPM